VFHSLIWGPWGFVWRGEAHQSTPVATGLNPPEQPIRDEARNDAHGASPAVKLHDQGCQIQGCHIKNRNEKLMMHQKVS